MEDSQSYRPNAQDCSMAAFYSVYSLLFKIKSNQSSCVWYPSKLRVVFNEYDNRWRKGNIDLFFFYALKWKFWQFFIENISLWYDVIIIEWFGKEK